MAELTVLRVFCAADGSGGNPLGVFVDGPEVPEERREGHGPRLTRETLEAEQRDEDAIR